MSTLRLYTERFFWFPRFKAGVKKILGRSFGGPMAVESSLLRGLSELSVPYELNKEADISETVGVLSGVEMLRQAIEWKKTGRVKKIIAGPNIVISPDNEDGILKDAAIDIILQPGKWTVDFYASVAPEISSKLRVWPAGVTIPQQGSTNKSLDFLIFDKLGGNQLVKDVIAVLKEKNFSFKVIKYGQFQQAQYFDLLNRSKALIHLSETESQGLAMFEAWAHGVPTLIFERGFWKLGKYSWQGNTASPYLTDESGMRFKDIEDFIMKLPEFLRKTFHPKEYVESNFSDKICAQKYLEFFE